MSSNSMRPARVFSPGRTIKGELDARGWTQRQLAQILGRPTQYVNELINGKRQLTPTSALELEAAFGPSAQFWLNLETAYRLRLAEDAATGLVAIKERAASAPARKPASASSAASFVREKPRRGKG